MKQNFLIKNSRSNSPWRSDGSGSHDGFYSVNFCKIRYFDFFLGQPIFEMSFINTLEALLDNWTEFCKLASGYKMYENWVSTITSKEQSPWDIGVNSEAFTGSRCPHRRQLDTCGEGECGGGTSFKIRDVGHSKERYDTGRVAITWYVTLSHCHTVTLSTSSPLTG